MTETARHNTPKSPTGEGLVSPDDSTEGPVFDFRGPDGQPISIEDALKKNLIHNVVFDSKTNRFTFDIIDIGDHTDPTGTPTTNAHEAMTPLDVQQPLDNRTTPPTTPEIDKPLPKSRRKVIAAIAAGAVGLASGIAIWITSRSDQGSAAPQGRPTASAPATFPESTATASATAGPEVIDRAALQAFIFDYYGQEYQGIDQFKKMTRVEGWATDTAKAEDILRQMIILIGGYPTSGTETRAQAIKTLSNPQGTQIIDMAFASSILGEGNPIETSEDPLVKQVRGMAMTNRITWMDGENPDGAASEAKHQEATFFTGLQQDSISDIKITNNGNTISAVITVTPTAEQHGTRKLSSEMVHLKYHVILHKNGLVWELTQSSELAQ